ncbi:MAG: polyhydroxyalkanoate depolymerase [Hyphomicrobiaceae bacterium]
MLYHWYEFTHAAVRPARAAANGYRMMLNHPMNVFSQNPAVRSTLAACEVFERTTRRYEKPSFDLPTTQVDGIEVDVTEEIVWQKPFCKLIHFKRDVPEARRGKDPRLLLVAPMSGHYATLLRGTVETFLPDHEVYITDWQDARDVPLTAGTFDLDDYVDTLSDIFRHFGGDVHVFAVCQPSVPVLAAIASMEAADDPHVPLSVMLAGGPVDTRVNPTAVNDLAVKKGTEWFRRNVITTVPWPSRGFGRPVYPGFLQLTGFMTMNLDRHVNAHRELFVHLVRGDGDNAEKHREFYDEYLAVMDLTAEFYLQTIESVFVEHRLPKGELRHRGELIDLGKVRRVAMMTIEGQNDDITGIGQCSAALDLCHNIPAENKLHFECPKVGHYGVFNGSRFRSEIAPRMRAFLRRFDARTRGQPTLTHFNPILQKPVVHAPDDAGLDLPDPSLLFTLPPANDLQPDAMAAKIMEKGIEAIGTPKAMQQLQSFMPLSLAFSSASLQMWSAFNKATIEMLERFEVKGLNGSVDRDVKNIRHNSEAAE